LNLVIFSSHPVVIGHTGFSHPLYPLRRKAFVAFALCIFLASKRKKMHKFCLSAAILPRLIFPPYPVWLCVSFDFAKEAHTFSFKSCKKWIFQVLTFRHIFQIKKQEQWHPSDRCHCSLYLSGLIFTADFSAGFI